MKISATSVCDRKDLRLKFARVFPARSFRIVNSCPTRRASAGASSAPARIAKAFADALPHAERAAGGDRDPRSRQAGSRGTLPGRPHPRRLRGDARRPGGRGDLHRDAAPGARRMGDQGRRGRQARALREADRRVGARGRGDGRTPPGRPGTFLGEAFMYRLHPQTAKMVELIKARGDRRAPRDQDAASASTCALRPDAPAVRQRHGRRRRSSMSAAIRCRWRG